jgi:hypothetical protein
VPSPSSILTALRELGPKQLGLYALYRLGLESGHYRRVSLPVVHKQAQGEAPFRPILPALPNREGLLARMGAENAQEALQEAEEILSGEIRLFGEKPVPLELTPPGPLQHWTDYELGRAPWGAEDVKFIWEPARFGWALCLTRAYQLTGRERYPAAFWETFEAFARANPANLGPNWASGQEVALRLIALAWAGQAFAGANATTARRRQCLAETIATHAARIPLTLVYARSQHNNHLLSEAAGLLTAAACLPEHPQAKKWQATGWRWLNAGFQAQITPEGVYAQHSANYHRLALHLGLWSQAVIHKLGLEWPEATHQKLAAATRWLLALADPLSGRLPNLGPNDGAQILPLSACPPSDYRPVLQAAAQTFLGISPFPPGPWDELADWLSGEESPKAQLSSPEAAQKRRADRPQALRGPNSWAYLRAAQFTSRPGHADQLHLDLWWRGLNIAQDAGTYRYSAPPPWENSLARTAVHNTLCLDGEDQMQRTGKFLFLKWAQAKILEHSQAADFEFLVAQVDSPHLGLIHERRVERREDEWRVLDRLLPRSGKPLVSQIPAALHWLLPDWPWKITTGEGRASLRLKGPAGNVEVTISLDSGEQASWGVRLVRAGARLHQSGLCPGEINPTLGWVSPTYNQKLAGLSLSIYASTGPHLALRTLFRFSE